MCLIVFSWKTSTEFPLIVAANRDEYYQRESAPATWWKDHLSVFAPRDLRAGGTWIGISKVNSENGSRHHKFAALTNVRDGTEVIQNAPSRGQLVSDYLIGTNDIKSTIEHLSRHSQNYNGFNLLLGEISESTQNLYWFSNRNASDKRNGQSLAPGIYGLSNSSLDSPWPKVCKVKAEMASLLQQNAPKESFFEMLSDTQPAPDHLLPNTGVSLELERLLSPVCIQLENYGTRSSILLKLSNTNELEYAERILR